MNVFENKRIVQIVISMSGAFVIVIYVCSSHFDKSFVALLVTLAYLAYSYVLCDIEKCLKTPLSQAIGPSGPPVVENIEMAIATAV